MSNMFNTKIIGSTEDMLVMQKSSNIKNYLWAQQDLKQVNSIDVWPRHCKRDLCEGRLWWGAFQIWDLGAYQHESPKSPTRKSTMDVKYWE
jgi:hypothetical protein